MYCYNGDNEDSNGSGATYGTPPPALGYVLLQGPIVEAGPSDSARFDGFWKRGYLNYEMTSFILYVNASFYWPLPHQADPQGALELYNYLSGKSRFGDPIINPITGEQTPFMVSGNPVNQEGWYEGSEWPGGPDPANMYFNFGSGLFNFAPGDAQEIVIAIAMAQGSNHLNSISVLKEKVEYIHSFYQNELFQDLHSPKWTAIPKVYELDQNYPNPFNSSTQIKFLIYKPQIVRIDIYNILGQKIQSLLDEHMPEGRHVVEFTAQNISSGIYFYRFQAGEFQDVKKMILLR